MEAARAASAAAGRGEVRSTPVAEARQQLGPVADALALDQAVASERAAEVGWRPRRPSFLDAAAEAYREWKGR